MNGLAAGFLLVTCGLATSPSSMPRQTSPSKLPFLHCPINSIPSAKVNRPCFINAYFTALSSPLASSLLWIIASRTAGTSRSKPRRVSDPAPTTSVKARQDPSCGVSSSVGTRCSIVAACAMIAWCMCTSTEGRTSRSHLHSPSLTTYSVIPPVPRFTITLKGHSGHYCYRRWKSEPARYDFIVFHGTNMIATSMSERSQTELQIVVYTIRASSDTRDSRNFGLYS